MSTRPFFDSSFDPMRDAVDAGSGGGQSERRGDTSSCAGRFATDDATGPVYNEEAFRYFLDIERKRSEISNRPFVLLLVDLKKEPSTMPEMDQASSQAVMSALSACVRETDFIGWYRARAVAAAVLTQHSDAAGAELHEA